MLFMLAKKCQHRVKHFRETFPPRGHCLCQTIKTFLNGASSTLKMLNISPWKKILTKYIFQLKEDCGICLVNKMLYFFKVFKAYDPGESLIKLNAEKKKLYHKS